VDWALLCFGFLRQICPLQICPLLRKHCIYEIKIYIVERSVWICHSCLQIGNIYVQLSFTGERIVDSKQALQWGLWSDEVDSTKHFAVQPHKGAAWLISVSLCVFAWSRRWIILGM